MAQKVTDPALLAILNGGDPVAIPLPASPQQQRDNSRQDALDRQAAADRAESARLARQNAEFEREKFFRTHNQDGTLKKAPDVVDQPLTPDQLAAVRAEAERKIGLLDSLSARSASWLSPGATGAGANWLKYLGGTPAFDQAADVETVSAAGALTKVMEMAKANGGKNPLTPLSEGDFANIAKSISNLDVGQSDAQFQKNARTYRDIYSRALRGAGGVDTTRLTPDGGMAALQQGYQALTQQMQGKTPAQRQSMLRAFNADPRIQAIKQRSGFRDPGGSTAGAPRKQPGVDAQTAAILSKYGVE